MDIYLDYGIMDNMKIISPEPKDYLVISGKGLINSLGIKTIIKSKKIKKLRYAITNVSLKDISKNLINLRSFLIRIICRRGPNMNLLTVNFI